MIDGILKATIDLLEWCDNNLFTFNGNNDITWIDFKNYLYGDGAKRSQDFRVFGSEDFYSLEKGISVRANSGEGMFHYTVNDGLMIVKSSDSIDDFKMDTLNMVGVDGLSNENLYWAQKSEVLNIVFDGVSVGRVKLKSWDDRRQISFNNENEITFGSLKNYITNKDPIETKTLYHMEIHIIISMLAILISM